MNRFTLVQAFIVFPQGLVRNRQISDSDSKPDMNFQTKTFLHSADQ